METDGTTGNSHTSGSGQLFGNNGGILTRTMKLECPRFNGQNPSGWHFKAKQYFNYNQVPHVQWPTIASLNMKGDALEWDQWYLDYQPDASWEQFVDAMETCFGQMKSENLAGRISKLRRLLQF